MDILSWAGENWFSLIQTLGIVAGFAIASRSFLLDSRARRVEVYLTLTQAHRDIWENVVTNPDLASVLDPARDIDSKPPTDSEERLVLLVLLHTASVHRASSLGVYPLWEGLKADIRDFYRLPVPSCVVHKYGPFQEPAFLLFIKQLIAEDGL